MGALEDRDVGTDGGAGDQGGEHAQDFPDVDADAAAAGRPVGVEGLDLVPDGVEGRC
jgi:hypothetical protein